MADKIKSAVDWADLDKGTLYIREKKLLSLVKERDFIETLFHSWIAKRPTENEKKMLNAVLVSFSGGWSIIPPVVFSARLAATTRAPVAQCLAAGFSASGPSHTSAIEGIMKIYLEKDLAAIEKFTSDSLENGRKMPGFGHPVLQRDPRPSALRKLCGELDLVGEAVEKFDMIEAILSKEKKIFGNVDGINGAILIDLGFRDSAYGPALFLMGRSIAMTAHIIEEYKNPPFKALELVYPGFRKIEYEYGDSLEKDKP